MLLLQLAKFLGAGLAIKGLAWAGCRNCFRCVSYRYF